MPKPGRVAVVVCVVLTAGCTSESPPSSPSPPAPIVAAATLSPSVSPPTVQVTPPAEVKGEVTRSVFARKGGVPDSQTTFEGEAREGRPYRLTAACAATAPAVTLMVSVRSAKAGASDDPVLSFELRCDGTRDGVDGITDLPAGPVGIDISGDRTYVTSMFALIAPDTGEGN